MSNYISLDTNIILLDANNLYTVGKDKTVVLTETILAEVDGKKTIMGDLGYNAREFGRILGKAELVGMEQKKEFHQTTLRLEGVNILLLANIDYGTIEKNDDKIIHATKLLEQDITMLKTEANYQLNPETGRYIKVGGVCHSKCVANGIL